MKTVKTDIYETITNEIVTMLENGGNQCRMPWLCTDSVNVLPINALTGVTYRGVNIVALWATAIKKDYLSGVWATFHQWKQLGATVRKGEKSAPVVFWSTVNKKTQESMDEDEAETVLFAKTYHVFNVAQVDGYEVPERHENREERIQEAEKFFSDLGVTVRESASAHYLNAEDCVYMPPFSSFFEQEGYYGVLSHEVTHWTGHEKRLNRDLSGRFGSNAYAMEELVAELGAAFLSATLGVTTKPREDHAGYIEKWLSVLKNDKRAIFTAASKAQQAVDWMRTVSESDRKAA